MASVVIVTRVEGTPMGSVAALIEAAGGVEEEFFFDGTATRYCLVGGETAYPQDGRWEAEPTEEAAFSTRMLVLRPTDPDAFNGTVIVEWNNVSGGEAFINAYTGADRLLRAGFAIVGVSAQRVGVDGIGGMVPGLPSLKSSDPDRYASLHHPGDDYSYDIFTQAGRLLAPSRAGDIDPLDGLDVRQLIAVGASQSSARLGAYVNAVHPIVSVYDALLLVVFPNTPTALQASDAPTEMEFGPNVFHLLDFYTHRLRADTTTPVIVLNSESEASECHPNHQPDTDFVRWWEIAGGSHTGIGSVNDMEAESPLVGTSISYAPALRGAYEALRRWLDDSEPPQRQPRLIKEGDPPLFARDEHGNAVGGIRWPDLAAPLGTHNAERVEGDGSNVLRGSSRWFTPEKVGAIYPDNLAWLNRYKDAVEHLVVTGVIVPGDAADLIASSERRRPIV